MFDKIVSSMLVAMLLTSAPINFAYSISEEERETRFQIEKVKTKVQEFGTGRQARVQVKLADGTTLKGYINEATDDRFVIMNSETNQAITVSYAQVTMIKKNGVSKPFKIGLVIAAAVFLVWFIRGATSD